MKEFYKLIGGLLFTSLVLTFFAHCKKDDPCPNEVTFMSGDFPEEVLEFNPFDNIDSLVYLNENNDSITFSKNSGYKEIKVDFRFLECRHNPSLDVNLAIEKTNYTYVFASNEGDTIKINYYPSLPSFLADYNNTDVPRFSYYMRINILINSINTEISTSPIIYRGNGSNELNWEIEESYELIGISHYDVYLFGIFEQNVFFNKSHGIVGFIDSNDNKWILSN